MAKKKKLRVGDTVQLSRFYVHTVQEMFDANKDLYQLAVRIGRDSERERKRAWEIIFREHPELEGLNVEYASGVITVRGEDNQPAKEG